MENRMPGRGAPARASGSAGAAARGVGHRRRPPLDAAGCRPVRQRRPADAPAAALKVLAAKLHRPLECFGSNRAFLRGVAQLGGFLARTSDGEPGWQTLWKGWSVLMTLVEGYELAQTINSAK